MVLLVSGLIEAFVTPSPLPTWARIGIGAVAEAAFLGYVIVSRPARGCRRGQPDIEFAPDRPRTGCPVRGIDRGRTDR